ncbi:hypothetical protein [Caulobacter phage ERS]|uniref:Uncharacterized protein n=1 Tax=Caulobacter phage ERS TaxID=3020392 RepID=A0AAE9X5C8_9CAUD|nr:hypothetical protein [Caulobacter phage ERS]
MREAPRLPVEPPALTQGYRAIHRGAGAPLRRHTVNDLQSRRNTRINERHYVNAIRIKWPTGNIEPLAATARFKGQVHLTAEGKAQARAMRGILGLKTS